MARKNMGSGMSAERFSSVTRVRITDIVDESVESIESTLDSFIENNRETLSEDDIRNLRDGRPVFLGFSTVQVCR